MDEFVITPMKINILGGILIQMNSTLFKNYITNYIWPYGWNWMMDKIMFMDSTTQMQISRKGDVATLLWPSVGVKPNTWKKRGFGVLRDSRMFRARQQGPKHLALRCSWCHWKGLEA
jgi:hypothetical protein